MRITGNMFWGIYLIIVGTLYLLRQQLHLQIPVFRVALAVFLIMLGITLLYGQFAIGSEQDFFFSSGGTTQVTKDGKYSVVFGDQTLDLTQMDMSKTHELEINTIFGSTTVYLDKNRNYRIRGSSAFGSMELPNGSRINFGETSQRTRDDLPETVVIKANVVFGEMKIEVR
jgi:predicted membrane protein